MTISSKDTNLPFSDEELRVFSDTELIDTKVAIMRKAESKLSELHSILSNRSAEWFIGDEFLKASGKISRGENHHGYPYLVLDYPRNLSASSGVSLRTLIWWGQHIMITLHVHGSGNDIFLKHLANNYHKLAESEFMVLASGNPWSNNRSDFRRIHDLEVNFEDHLKNEISNRGVLRLAQFRDLSEINYLLSIAEKATDILFTKTY